MGTSRLEQLIEDIYDFVESCKPLAFSTTKVVVAKDELYDLLDELKLRTPDEIKRYQKIVANRDQILADAEQKAEAMLEEARHKTDEMINQSDVMQLAYERAEALVAQATEQAQQILMEANQDAAQIRSGSLSYAAEMLGEVEKVMSHSYESTRSRVESLVETLQSNVEVLRSNRSEIIRELNGGSTGSDESTEGSDEGYDDEFNFSADTFLQDID